ncbi:glucokinase [Thalassotalea profundi]|uniref:Glucokinase n=1 Tax=Thalassotalea profundi TaxID=2036687 RepID=A0ABQ3IFZ4_9GAMM|nr:glucokinase [Thalassotalea profundi]GHE83239.1 glucokinase [Thalassotalea profundi]
MTDQVINIVADIGGTNLRIGVINEKGNVDLLTVYQCNDFDDLSAIVQTFLVEKSIVAKEINACFAIACPVDNDLIKMTNLPWQFSKSELKQILGFKKLLFINDYTAIAHAIPFLNDEQKVKVGGGSVIQGKPISICGPGTGLGVANVVPVGSHWEALGGEGGHVDFAPVDATEIAILEILLKKYNHVSYEQILSGLGLEQIYHALCEIHQRDLPKLSAQEISTNALNKQCDICQQTLEQFCKTLGSFAGNLALTLASFGGVYIAGGIVPRFTEYLINSEFRSRFEDKGRFNLFNSSIPTFVVTESQPGILGASAYLRQHNKEEL